MTKTHLTLFVSLIIMTLSLNSQPPVGQRGERPLMPNTERFTERFTERMTKELNLNTATSKKVHGAFFDNIKKWMQFLPVN